MKELSPALEAAGYTTWYYEDKGADRRFVPPADRPADRALPRHGRRDLPRLDRVGPGLEGGHPRPRGAEEVRARAARHHARGVSEAAAGVADGLRRRRLGGGSRGGRGRPRAAARRRPEGAGRGARRPACAPDLAAAPAFAGGGAGPAGDRHEARIDRRHGGRTARDSLGALPSLRGSLSGRGNERRISHENVRRVSHGVDPSQPRRPGPQRAPPLRSLASSPARIPAGPRSSERARSG